MFKCNNCDKSYKSQSRFLKHKYNCIDKQSKKSRPKKITKIEEEPEEELEEEPEEITNEVSDNDTKSGYGSDRSRRSTKSGYGSDRSRRSTKSGYGSDRSRRSTKSGYGSDRSLRSESGYGSDRSLRSESGYGSDRSLRSGYSSYRPSRRSLMGRDTDIVKIRDLVDRLRRDKKRYKQEILDLKSDARTLEYTENNLRNEILLISTEKQELNEKLSDLVKENEEVISKYSDGENTLTQLNQQRTYLIKYTKELTDKLNQHDQKSKEILQKQTQNSEKIIELKDKRIQELASLIIKNATKHTNDMEKLKIDLEKIHEKEKAEIETKFSGVIRNLTSSNVMIKNEIVSQKEEYEQQLNTLRTDYETKLKDTTEKLKSNWASDVIEQRKELNKTIQSQKSYILELDIKLENYTKLYEEYLEKYNTTIREKSESIVDYKKDLDKIFDDRLQQEVVKIKRQYETDNDIKLLKDEIEGYKKQLLHFKQNAIHTNSNITTKTNEFKEYKNETEKLISKLRSDVKKIQDKREKESIYNSKRTRTIRSEYEKTLSEYKVQISDLEHKIASQHKYKIDLDKNQNDNQKLREELNLSKLIIVNEREKFKKEYEQLQIKNDEDMKMVQKELKLKNTEIDTYKKKLLVNHTESNTNKEKLQDKIVSLLKEQDELLSRVQSTERINELMKSEMKREKENFNKQLTILESYKNDNNNSIDYIKDKLIVTEKELEKFKAMSKDLHQRLMVRSDDFRRAKNRVVDLENLLENTVKKFSNN